MITVLCLYYVDGGGKGKASNHLHS